MTAAVTKAETTGAPRTTRRLGLVLAAAGVCTVAFGGLAPAAAAQDVRSQQWYLGAMQLEKVWKVSTGKGMEIAVIDDGVNTSTSSLRGQVVSEGAADSSSSADFRDGHGTTMAELIAGTGRGGGIRGVAPDAKIVPIRTALLKDKNSKKAPSLDKAIRLAADSDAKIISMSLGGEFYSSRVEAAVKYAAAKGKLMFAATGNDGAGKNRLEYPANYQEVVGIGATDEAGTVTKFSGSGIDVDLVAPGEDLPSWCDATFRRYCEGGKGTSHATAIASGSAALIWSKHPDWTANQVLRVLIDTAGRASKSDKPSKYIGYGGIRPRINLVDGEGNPGDPGVNPLTGDKTGPAKSASPSSGSTENDAAGKVSVADSSGTDDNSQLWTMLGVGAAVVVLGGGAFAIRRARRG